MSQLELNRLETIQRILDKRLSVVDAASHLSLSRSQVHRLIAQYRKDGASGLISKKRGKPSNRRYPDTVRNFAIHIVTEHYADFGPTFAAEKLRENHELSVSKETLRKWMMEADLWQHKTRRKDRIHQPRHRRDRFGELIQIDGSHHPWFEALQNLRMPLIISMRQRRISRNTESRQRFIATNTGYSEPRTPPIRTRPRA